MRRQGCKIDELFETSTTSEELPGLHHNTAGGSMQEVGSDWSVAEVCTGLITTDVAHPQSINRREVLEIKEEIFSEDAYGLSILSGPGDIWTDIGCHVGLFSLAAITVGAEVSAVVDMDIEAARCAAWNIEQYRQRIDVRGLYGSRMPTAVFSGEINRHDELVEMSMLTKEMWEEGRNRACLKMDIQGAETSVFDKGGAIALAEAFDVMVFEWHYDRDIAWFLEQNMWNIDRMHRHEDALLKTQTKIFWATSRVPSAVGVENDLEHARSY